MTEVVKRWVGGGSEGLHFWCPGCDEVHQIVYAPTRWSWNGDLVKPTISPSILVQGGHYAPGWKGPTCYCNSKAPDGSEWGFTCHRCHSFVTDGRIQFLGDCTHSLKGQTVDLPPWRGYGEPDAS